MTTTDKNEVIALWMGLETNSLHCKHSDLTGYRRSTAGIFLLPSQLKYHSDWNWLCLVIEKIRSTQECSDFNINFLGDCKIECEDYGKTFEEYCSNTVDTKQAVHEAVYQFVAWHNQQVKENPKP